MPKLQLRMGVHGPISRLVDVTERANVAGAGINIAQRVPTISSNGAFSGLSQVTGRFLSGQISAGSIALTYNGVSQSAAKLPSYGPTRAFAGGWIGEVTDPSTGTGVGEALITSNGRIVVFSFQDFFIDAGVGTIDSSGNFSTVLLSDRTIAGVFSASNRTAQGTFSISTGGTQSDSVVRAVPARFFNISTRGIVGTGEQVLIAGFIIVDGGEDRSDSRARPFTRSIQRAKSCPKYPARPVPRSTIDCI